MTSAGMKSTGRCNQASASLRCITVWIRGSMRVAAVGGRGYKWHLILKVHCDWIDGSTRSALLPAAEEVRGGSGGGLPRGSPSFLASQLWRRRATFIKQAPPTPPPALPPLHHYRYISAAGKLQSDTRPPSNLRSQIKLGLFRQPWERGW